MQVDERDHNEGEGGRGQARGPVMHAEVLEDEHCTPVVKRRLFQPGLSIEIGGDAGAQLGRERVRRVEPVQHLMRDLRIAGFIGSHQAQVGATEDRSQPVCQKEDRESKKENRFTNASPGRETPAQFFGRIRIGRLQKRFQVADNPTGQPAASACGRVRSG